MSDFGLSKSLYEKLYFRQDKCENVKLPIKWMAIESIEYGLFSEKSDIVSSLNYNTIIATHFSYLNLDSLECLSKIKITCKLVNDYIDFAVSYPSILCIQF